MEHHISRNYDPLNNQMSDHQLGAPPLSTKESSLQFLCFLGGPQLGWLGFLTHTDCYSSLPMKGLSFMYSIPQAAFEFDVPFYSMQW